MTKSNMILKDLINFRKHLHQHPELSGKEFETIKLISKFIKRYHPGKIISPIGKTGLLAIYEGKEPGKTVMIRGDIDALPIKETNSFNHKSINRGISHKCGHDGHTAILAGVAAKLNQNPISNGKVVLLFQPAEETGKGALEIINDTKFKAHEPDYIFGLHNLPGFSKNSIIVKYGVFASASKGLIIKLFGKTAHAAYPEKGLNPALAMTEIIQELVNLPSQKDLFSEYVLLTIIHAQLGKIAFGISPGQAEIMATLRSYQNDDMNTLSEKCLSIIKKIAEKNHLTYSTEWADEFFTTNNDRDAVEIITTAAQKNNLTIKTKKEPFPWSEDFGVFTQKNKGALFGLGAGVGHTSLHNLEYDFPDDIIESGVMMFYNIIQQVIGDR